MTADVQLDYSSCLIGWFSYFIPLDSTFNYLVDMFLTNVKFSNIFFLTLNFIWLMLQKPLICYCAILFTISEDKEDCIASSSRVAFRVLSGAYCILYFLAPGKIFPPLHWKMLTFSDMSNLKFSVFKRERKFTLSEAVRKKFWQKVIVFSSN